MEVLIGASTLTFFSLRCELITVSSNMTCNKWWICLIKLHVAHSHPPQIKLPVQTWWVRGNHWWCCVPPKPEPPPCTGSDGHPQSAWSTRPQGLQRTEPLPLYPTAAPEKCRDIQRVIKESRKGRSDQSSSYYKHSTALSSPVVWAVMNDKLKFNFTIKYDKIICHG